MGDKSAEGVYCNLGIAFQNLSDNKRAMHYHNLSIMVAKEIRNKFGEGKAYGNLGNTFSESRRF